MADTNLGEGRKEVGKLHPEGPICLGIIQDFQPRLIKR